MRGLRGGSSPSTMCRSVRQTPQASTRRSACPGFASGAGTSSIFRGDCEIGAAVVRTAAFMNSNSMPDEKLRARLVARAMNREGKQEFMRLPEVAEHDQIGVIQAGAGDCHLFRVRRNRKGADPQRFCVEMRELSRFAAIKGLIEQIGSGAGTLCLD